MNERIKRSGWPLACAAAFAALSLNGLAPLPAKSTPLFISTWQNAQALLNGGLKECLGVLGGSMTDGTPVVTWACNGHPDQKWEIDGAPGVRQTQIRNGKDPNMCLGVLAAATTNGSSLVIWDCNGSPDQEWSMSTSFDFSLINGPDGCFVVHNGNASTKVMGALGGNPGDGTQAVIWDDLTASGHFDQAWCPN